PPMLATPPSNALPVSGLIIFKSEKSENHPPDELGFAWINLDLPGFPIFGLAQAPWIDRDPGVRTSPAAAIQTNRPFPDKPATLRLEVSDWILDLGIPLDVGDLGLGHSDRFGTRLSHSNFRWPCASASPFEISKTSKNHRQRVARNFPPTRPLVFSPSPRPAPRRKQPGA